MPANAPQPHRPSKPAPGAPRPKSKPAPKPGGKPSPPADSFLGWLGRQVGHVKNAVKTDVTKPAKSAKPKQAAPVAKPAAAKAAARPQPGPAPASAAPTGAPTGVSGASNAPPSMVVYRNDKIEEAELPDRPGVKLRRTIIDEVIVEKKDE